MSDAEIERKFRDLSTDRACAERMRRGAEALWDLEQRDIAT